VSPTSDYRVIQSWVRFDGRPLSFVSDLVAMPDGGQGERDYLRHPGSVSVLALDRSDAVVLIRHYRHPVGQVLWELPAGLRDVAGEAPAQTASRELAEETGLGSASWSELLTLQASPGTSDETVHVFLAVGVEPVSTPQPARIHEEAELSVHRIPFDEAVDMVLRGVITNATAVAALLAANALRQRDDRRLLRSG
jgi:ADP-ribose pyrophosphatase